MKKNQNDEAAKHIPKEESVSHAMKSANKPTKNEEGKVSVTKDKKKKESDIDTPISSTEWSDEKVSNIKKNVKSKKKRIRTIKTHPNTNPSIMKKAQKVFKEMKEDEKEKKKADKSGKASKVKVKVIKKFKAGTKANVNKPVEEPEVKKSKRTTKLKVWMNEHGINQKQLAAKTTCSSNTINRLVNNGHASNSVVKLVANELGISFEQIKELLKFTEPITI